jgi:hypothetical protein
LERQELDVATSNMINALTSETFARADDCRDLGRFLLAVPLLHSDKKFIDLKNM